MAKGNSSSTLSAAESDNTDPLQHFHVAARVASRNAIQHGLVVSVETSYSEAPREEIRRIVWRGNADLFVATGVIRENALPVRNRWLCPGSLRGRIYREAGNQFRFVIEWVCTTGRPSRKDSAKARTDTAYQAFRMEMLKPLSEKELAVDAEGGAA